MQYIVMNMEAAHAASLNPVGVNTAVISIINTDAPSVSFGSPDWLKDVLEVRFNDVPAGFQDCMTVKDAVLIANFVYEMVGKVDRFIIHCTYGASRSPAIAAALMLCMEGSDREIWDNPNYAPNKNCYKLMADAMKNCKIKMG